jgi:hypothetical protein
MPRRIDIENEWDGEDDFEFGEIDEDFDPPNDDDEPTVPCPYCRRQILEDTPRCPFCENYISAEDVPASPKPWWLIIGFLACSVIVLLWILRP